ncbi:Ankyrin Repeat [Perkinsus olseni]|uniref:Ankyrin Repeat n=1 Tax=Perkinsus olseni TaxID=32597 RepID=A0A7J6PAI4_PEROL|nr:Ankyrin Repeat [Perkinsus olseni]
MATATGQPSSEGSWTSKEALLAQLASLQRVIQLQDATCENRSPADLSWRHEAVKLSVEKQAIQDECLEMVKQTHERTREHVVKVESKLIELAEESDDAQRRLKVSQREAKALAKENDRLTKMVAQMHAAIVESRASLESCERRASAAESLAAKLAGDRTGSDKLTHTDVSSSMRDATPRADSPPERAAVEASNGDDQEALSCVVGSDKTHKESRLLSAASASLSPMPEHIRELESRRLEGLASLREWETEREISAISWSGRVEEIRIQLGKIMDNGIKETHDACVFLEKRIEIDLKYAQDLEALPDEPSNWNEYSRRTGKLLHDFNEATQTTLIDKGLKEVEVEYKGRMDEILRSLDGVVEECQSAEEAVAEAWKQHEGLFMSRFTHGAGASATDRWSSERNYREAVSAAAQRRSMVEGYLVSSVAIANKAEAWREQNTTSVVRHWLTKQYQLWLHVSSAAQDQQRVLTEELTEAALSATGQVDSVAALRISPTRKDSILASPRAEDSTREKFCDCYQP